MENDTKTLRRFVLNFFENERYLNPDESRLSSGEMLAYHQNPKSAQTNRLLMDRVLNDPEFLETRTAADSDTSASEIATAPSNVHYLSEIKHRFPGAKRFKRVDKNELKKVATSIDTSDPTSEDAIQVKDENLEGYLQIIEYKDNQYLISGHFSLFSVENAIRLILPSGRIMADFEKNESVIRFRVIVPEKIDLTQICYELY